MEKQTISIKRSIATAFLGVALLAGSALTWTFTSSGKTVLGATRPVELRMAPASSSPAVGPVSLIGGLRKCGGAFAPRSSQYFHFKDG